MTRSERSRRRVAELRTRLERDHGTFAIVEKTWRHSASRYQRCVDRFESGADGGAGVWLTNDAGEVLLVRNESAEGWSDPGGKREAGESYEGAARRETREETGIDCRLTGVRELHVIENRRAGGDEPAVFEAVVIFDAEYVGGEPRPREGEIAEVGWFATPPATVRYDEVRTRPYPAGP